jgi:pantoate--beta-alanine ligase
MHCFYDTVAPWQAVRRALPADTTLGFVPTMGNLHAGHMTLVEQSMRDNTKTIVSLFVNPTQFNRPEDFNTYPKTLDADLKQLEQAGVDYCLMPAADVLYADNYRYQLDETERSLMMEGKHRPGHFAGVLTVVMKFFQLVRPTHAYLGEKDYQQLMLIQGMIDAFFLDIKLCACPTFREPSGLAYSSRNNRLSDEGREQADTFARLFHAATSCEEAIMTLQEHGLEVEYIEEYEGRRFAVVYIEGVRLIDNYPL